MNLITILTENMIRFRTKNITPANLKTILDKSPIVINESVIDFATWPREMIDQLDSSFIAAIKYWKDYLNNVNVQKKISINLYGSINMPNMIKTQQLISHWYMYLLDKIKETGWADDLTDPNAVRFTMQVESSDTYKVRVNMHYYNKFYKEHGIIKMGTLAKNTFVHEMQHIMFRVAKGGGYVKPINPQANIKLAFPLGFDTFAPSANASKQLVQAQISQSSKNDLAANGIDYNKLIAHYNTEYWKKQYTCYETELMSRLASYREYLTDRKVIQMGGTILLTTISSDIKKIINGQAYGDDLLNFRQMIGCWVLGGMTPRLTDFVNKLNALAKNSIQDKNNVDFTQMDQDERT
jgi:hypothetical protein